MAKIFVEDVICAKRSAIFDLVQDYRHRLDWDSHAKRVRFDNGNVTSWRRVGSVFSWFSPFSITVEHIGLAAPSLAVTCMIKGPFLFSDLYINWYFTRLADEKTLVRMRYDYKARWSILGWVFDPLIAHCLERDGRIALSDLKHAAEQTDLLSQYYPDVNAPLLPQTDFFGHVSMS